MGDYVSKLTDFFKVSSHGSTLFFDLEGAKSATCSEVREKAAVIREKERDGVYITIGFSFPIFGYSFSQISNLYTLSLI